jgi:hypothetical protein
MITRNSECSADFGEARGMTDHVLNGLKSFGCVRDATCPHTATLRHE